LKPLTKVRWLGGDSLGIGLSVLQIIWLLVHSISRTVQRLPISQLELATIAICFAAITNYALWWHKPRNIEEKIVLGPLPPDIERTEHFKEALGRGYRAYNLIAPMALLEKLHQTNWQNEFTIIRTIQGLGFASVAFCGIHLVAWNWSFASVFEKWLWRVSNCLCLVSSLGVVACLWFLAEIKSKHMGYRIVCVSLVVFVGAYILARVCVVIEVFIAFRSMPEELYTIQPWTRYFPHF